MNTHRKWMIGIMCAVWFLRLDSYAQENGAEVALPTRTWLVPADFLDRLHKAPSEADRESDPRDPFSGADANVIVCYIWMSLPRMFEMRGEITFPPGSFVDFSPHKGELVVKSAKADLDRIDRMIQSMGAMKPFLLDEKLFSAKGSLLMNAVHFSEKFVERSWHIDPSVMDRFQARDDQNPPLPDPFSSGENEEIRPAKVQTLTELMALCGIGFPPGTSIAYDRATGTLKSIHSDHEAFKIEIMFFHIALAMAQAGEK